MNEFQSTDKLADNPYPERSHLLAEDFIEIAAASYTPVTGGYIATATVNLTNLLALGNRNKGFPPQNVEINAWHLKDTLSGGQYDDYYLPVPYTIFSNFSTGQVESQVQLEQHNLYIVIDDTASSTLTITHFAATQPVKRQKFAYRIYNNVISYE